MRNEMNENKSPCPLDKWEKVRINFQSVNQMREIDGECGRLRFFNPPLSKSVNNNDLRRKKNQAREMPFFEVPLCKSVNIKGLQNRGRDFFKKTLYTIYIFVFFYSIYIYIYYFFTRIIYKNKKNLFSVFVTICRIKDFQLGGLKKSISRGRKKNPYNSLLNKGVTNRDFEFFNLPHLTSIPHFFNYLG